MNDQNPFQPQPQSVDEASGAILKIDHSAPVTTPATEPIVSQSTTPLETEPLEPKLAAEPTPEPAALEQPIATTTAIQTEPAAMATSVQEEPAPTTPAMNFVMGPSSTDEPAMDIQGAPVSEEPAAKKSKGSKSPLALAVAIIGGLALAGWLAVLYLLNENGFIHLKEEVDIFATDAFFLSDENDEYALFNEAGDKLSLFIFKKTSDFVDNTALVSDDSGEKYGIIDNKGKMLVDFGKYKEIERVGGLYRADDHLITGHDKVILELKDGNKVIDNNNSLVVVQDNNKLKALNYKGKAVKLDGGDIDSLVISEDVKGATVVFIDGTNYLIDSVKGRIITKFKDERNYLVSGRSDKYNAYYLTADYSNNYSYLTIKGMYKLVLNNKLTKVEGCDALTESQSRVYCVNGDDSIEAVWLLSEDFKTKLILIMDKNGLKNGQMFSYADFAVSNKSDNEGKIIKAKTFFYKNGKQIATVACKIPYGSIIADSNQKHYYLLRNYSGKNDSDCKDVEESDKLYSFYTIDGEQAFGKEFYDAGPFSDDGVTYVAEEKDKYYLINNRGEKISSEYGAISAGYEKNEEGGYTVYYEASENKRGSGKGKVSYLNKDGKEMFTVEDGDEYATMDRFFNDKLYIVTSRELENYNYYDSFAYAVYELDSGKKIIDDKKGGYIYLGEHYITVNTYKNESTQYYTYGGKLFHECKKK